MTVYEMFCWVLHHLGIYTRTDGFHCPDVDTVEIGGLSYITTDELAQRLGVSAKTIWRWQKQGFLPALVKIGRVRLYREDRLAAWVATYENN
jgi:excisionase family DNA binding protein